MSVYYNEIDKFAAAWLRELMKAGQIPDGEIDTRSIADVQPGDLRKFGQCHFFAGVGGWAYALRLAGWPDDRPVWTGSCPCQPFSQAGRGASTADPRHLWPAWFRLISERRPSLVFGEQVASADGVAWLDVVLDDLESENYACGPFDLPACGAGASHGRPRLYFVGDRAWPNANCGDEHRRAIAVQVGRERIETPPKALHTSRRNIWPTQSRPALLAYGVSNRMERLRGFGNAIVPQVAQVFIEAYLGMVCSDRGQLSTIASDVSGSLSGHALTSLTAVPPRGTLRRQGADAKSSTSRFKHRSDL